MHGSHYDRAGHVLSPGRKNLGIFVDNLPDMLLNKSWNDAYADAAQEDNAAAFVAQEGIRAAAEGKDLRLALDTAYSTAAAELRAHLNYLSMIVTLSPFGAFGNDCGYDQFFPDFQFTGGTAYGYHRGLAKRLSQRRQVFVSPFSLLLSIPFLRKRWMIF